MKASLYVDSGLALVPIPHASKGPSTVGWNLRENVVIDPRRARNILGNIGLAHAYCLPTPTAALDIDDMVAAETWLMERKIDVHALLDAGDAVQIVSGRAGRGKLLFRLPPGTSPLVSMSVRHNKKTILELRCATANGATVQDVLPPSIHPITRLPYAWGGNGTWRALPTMPQQLTNVWLEELANHHSPVGAPFVGTTTKAVDDTPRQRARLAAMTSHICADCSYELYRDIVWAHLSLGWHDAEDLARKWCQTAPYRFDDASFETVVRSYDFTRTPTIGTIHYHAKAGGWRG